MLSSLTTPLRSVLRTTSRSLAAFLHTNINRSMSSAIKRKASDDAVKDVVNGSDGKVAPNAKRGKYVDLKVPAKQASDESIVPYGDVKDRTKVLSVNVNGLRASLDKRSLADYIRKEDADIVLLQEIKVGADKRDALSNRFDNGPFTPSNKKYAHVFWDSYTEQDGKGGGKHGVAAFCRVKPLRVKTGIDIASYAKNENVAIDTNDTGRVMLLEFDEVCVVNVYTPNSGMKLDKLPYRKHWDEAFTRYLKAQMSEIKKPFYVMGDLNVTRDAYWDIALGSKRNEKLPGATTQERESFADMLQRLGLTDLDRHQHDGEVRFTYWSFRHGAIEKNTGWRLDYTLTNDESISNASDTAVPLSFIRPDVRVSDHVPLGVLLPFRLGTVNK